MVGVTGIFCSSIKDRISKSEKGKKRRTEDT